MTNTEIKNEFLSDFKALFEKVNPEAYNPVSPEFMNSVFTGMMYLILEGMEQQKEAVNEIVRDEIQDELMSAEKYYEMYMKADTETRKNNYRAMVLDELSHADFLIKEATEIDPVKKQSYTQWHEQIRKRM